MMKDKLEKTGHKKAYHSFRKTMLGLGVLFMMAGVSAIPVGISYQMAERAAAEQASVSRSVEIEDSSSSEEPIEVEVEG